MSCMNKSLCVHVEIILQPAVLLGAFLKGLFILSCFFYIVATDRIIAEEKENLHKKLFRWLWWPHTKYRDCLSARLEMWWDEFTWPNWTEMLSRCSFHHAGWFCRAIPTKAEFSTGEETQEDLDSSCTLGWIDSLAYTNLTIIFYFFRKRAVSCCWKETPSWITLTSSARIQSFPALPTMLFDCLSTTWILPSLHLYVKTGM